jgi:alpha-L-glutamate ligase-like protein
MLKDLRAFGILGMNERIREYILLHNPRRLLPQVDNKIVTAQLVQKHQIPMPEQILSIKRHGDLRYLHRFLPEQKSFVAKPSRGAMGNGVLIVEKQEWNADLSDASMTTPRDEKLSLKDFKYYLSDILSGLYSLDGMPDDVIIQEKLEIHPAFANFSFRGIPDIRVIIYKGFPVMAMIRLATSGSGGRANLHQGAVGSGINIATGAVTYSVHQNRRVELHPDFKSPLSDLKIPQWREILLLSARCFDAIPLGYMGVDIVIHKAGHPLLLEMNARPGLSIQIANQRGLKPRLQRVTDFKGSLSAEERVEWSQSAFDR